MSNPQQLVQKLWNYCNIVRDGHTRKERARFKSFTYDELLERDKVNLDTLIHAPRAFGPPALRFASSLSHASRRLGSG